MPYLSYLNSATYGTLCQLKTAPIAKSAIFRYCRGMKEIDSFTDRVIQAIETKRQEKGMAVAELIAKSGITRRTWFRKMRGDTEFTTSEIDAIAKALDCDALLLLQEAAHEPTDEETVIKATLQKLQENPMLLAAYMSKEKEKDEAINGAAGPDYDEPA